MLAALQDRFPWLEVLHVAREVVRTLALRDVREVGLLATAGTYNAGLYDQAFTQAGVQCYAPLVQEREQLMHGTYNGVKVDNMALAHRAFARVAEALAKRHRLQTLVLACSEFRWCCKRSQVCCR